jgi:tRNA(Ile)-lysidine synthetase-like protein
MLNYLIDFVLYSHIRFINYKNILELLPADNRRICEYYYNEENDLLKTIKQFCINSKNKKFIISLSGGVDSMVLISIIHYLGYQVIGAHINYNNRDETLLEQEFLTYWCNYNKIKLHTKTIQDLKRSNSKRSDYEYITKKIRFDFYKEIMNMENINMILLGHHKDDIVENIFANVCRGRYILDLAVIKKESIVENVNIGRPMIEFYKKSIYEFANLYQVPYFKDTTPSWSVRGKYRNEIYPKIEDAFTPNVKENLIGLSNQSYEWNNLVQQQIIKPFLDNIVYLQHGVTFNIETYTNYPLCFWSLIFMNIFYNFNKSCPSRKGIQNFMNNIKEKNNCYISISNSCVTSIKNYVVLIKFKF